MARITAPDDGGWSLATLVLDGITSGGTPDVPHLLLYGPPGTGKSTLAALHGSHAWFRILCHEEMSDVDIIGGPALDGSTGGTSSTWNDGAGLRAWSGGQRLIVDEIDKAGGAALSALLAILDSPMTAAYTIPSTGETRRPVYPGFHCVATMNGNPSDLPAALRDRFPVCVEITQPHPDAINALPADLRAAAAASANAKGNRRTSVRAWRAFASLRAATGDEERAALAVFGVGMADDVCDALTIARDGGAPDALAALYR